MPTAFKQIDAGNLTRLGLIIRYWWELMLALGFSIDGGKKISDGRLKDGLIRLFQPLRVLNQFSLADEKQVNPLARPRANFSLLSTCAGGIKPNRSNNQATDSRFPSHCNSDQTQPGVQLRSNPLHV